MGVARQVRALRQQFSEGRIIARIKGGSRGGHPPIVVSRAAYRKRQSAISAIWVLPGIGDFLGWAGRANRTHAATGAGQEGHRQQQQKGPRAQLHASFAFHSAAMAATLAGAVPP
jgi:hypothetical protein